ncbi:MAG: carboxypeptidase-like regulatory domain-containing protein [Planctomycetota bacterium]|jgi:hypothetical protein
MNETVLGVVMTALLAACDGSQGGTAVVRGLVQDGAGDPVAGAEVLLIETAAAQDGDDDGAFEFEVEPGTYTVHVGDSEIEIECDDGEVVEIRCELDGDEVVEIDVDDIETATADAEGEASYRVDTADGDELPGGAETLDDLAGKRLEAKLGDDVLIVAEVPDMPQDREKDGEEKDGEEKSEEDVR